MKARLYLGEVVKDAAGSKYVIIAFDHENKSISIWRLNFIVGLLSFALRSRWGQRVSNWLRTGDRETVATVSELYPLESELP